MFLMFLASAAAYDTIGSTWPVESMPVPWHIGALPDDLAEADAIAAMQAGFDAWEDAGCGVSFDYQGRAEGAAPGIYDGINVISFLDDWPDDPALLSSPVIVVDGEDIVEADVGINGQYFAWALDGADGVTAFDLQSTVTHEVGHVLGLWHSTDPDASLNPVLNGNPEGRTLGDDDLEGLCDLYEGAVPAGQGALGDACEESDDCQEGLFCLVDQERRYCSTECASDADCPQGYECFDGVAGDLGGGEAACAVTLEEGCGGCGGGGGGLAGLWSSLAALAALARRRLAEGVPERTVSRARSR